VSCCAAPAASAWFSGVCLVLCLLLVMTAVPWPLGAGVLVFFFSVAGVCFVVFSLRASVFVQILIVLFPH
jgi:hypothetical protein